MAHFDRLDDKLEAFITAQHMFFVATAPREGGRVNVSPKGIDGLRVLDHETVAYLDLTGSGNETAAHVNENGRLTIMLCSVLGPPKILRLYGTGRIVAPRDAEWEHLASLFPPRPGTRQLVVLNIDAVQTSCGFGVPLYEYRGQRETLIRWAEEKGENGIDAYRREKNVTSIDGLPTGLAV